MALGGERGRFELMLEFNSLALICVCRTRRRVGLNAYCELVVWLTPGSLTCVGSRSVSPVALLACTSAGGTKVDPWWL